MDINTSLLKGGHGQSRNEWVDKAEAEMLSKFPAIEPKITDLFTNGLYAREMLIAVQSAGFDWVFLTSEIHNTEHMYYVGRGSLLVSTDDGPPVLVKAPYHGITKPGTRRVAIALEDTIWTTFHANPKNETVDEIRERIIEKYKNPLITDQMKRKMLEARENYLKTKLVI